MSLNSIVLASGEEILLWFHINFNINFNINFGNCFIFVKSITCAIWSLKYESANQLAYMH